MYFVLVLTLGIASSWAQDGKATELQNVCPPFFPASCKMVKPGPDECKDDSQCPHPKKCCCSKCGLKCVNPVQVKQGRCPAILVKCPLLLSKPKCQSDKDCPGKQKCCNICGKSCWDPEPEPDGFCPVPVTMEVQSHSCLSQYCSSDAFCPADKKCCIVKDGQKCVIPQAIELQNVCPPFFPASCKMVKPGPDECKDDSQCPPPKKCCCSKCGLKCVNPVQVKEGRCPAILVKCPLLLPKPKCQSDKDCPGKQKCCNICGKSCRDPEPEPDGCCPVHVTMEVQSHSCLAQYCSSDAFCPADKKCCIGKDWQKCVIPQVTQLQNVCPPFDPAVCITAKPAPDECKDDSQCPYPNKCCCMNCGLKCVPPVQVKKGRCPAIFAKCIFPFPEPECMSDNDCPGKQKCCNICGESCWDPDTEPVGICPVAKNMEVPCSSWYCSSDADCMAGRKCCVTEGGQMCVTPSTEKPGICPAVMAMCIFPLKKPQCQTDFDCPGKQKCCDLCGNSCLDPEPDKPGECPEVMTLIACEENLPPLCSHDIWCPENQKCCNIGCQMMCTEPKDKPGECPEVMTLIACKENLPPLCSHDIWCPDNQKCCNIGCQMMCTEPKGPLLL